MKQEKETRENFKKTKNLKLPRNNDRIFKEI